MKIDFTLSQYFLQPQKSENLYTLWSMKNLVHFTSLGCARNLVDTEVMLGLVIRAGLEITPEYEEADYLVINTCGFLESARQEALDNLEELFYNKKSEAKVIVVGCMVQTHQNVLKEAFPDIHYFLGSGDTEKIVEAIQADQSGSDVSSAKSYLQQGETPRFLTTPEHYAYLKIAEGCRKQCAFCIIPKIKGKLRSKTTEQVMKEFSALIQSGVYEVILIAQDLGDFGKDRREIDGLAALLREMLSIPGDFWIRMLYLYPDEITDEIIEIMKNDDRLCPYLDMPIQHINDLVLKSMLRKTDRAHIENTLTKLRREIPQIVIRTSLMVGFPGETDEQFQELCDFVAQGQLDNIGIFKYSNEDLAYSSTLPNHISEKVKQERFEILAEVQKNALENLNQRYVGQTLKVLIEGYHPDSPFLMIGRFSGQCPDIDGQVIINDCEAVTHFGALYEVEISDVMGYDLIGGAIQPVHTGMKVLV